MTSSKVTLYRRLGFTIQTVKRSPYDRALPLLPLLSKFAQPTVLLQKTNLRPRLFPGSSLSNLRLTTALLHSFYLKQEIHLRTSIVWTRVTTNGFGLEGLPCI